MYVHVLYEMFLFRKFSNFFDKIVSLKMYILLHAINFSVNKVHDAKIFFIELLFWIFYIENRSKNHFLLWKPRRQRGILGNFVLLQYFLAIISTFIIKVNFPANTRLIEINNDYNCRFSRFCILTTNFLW